MASNINPYSYYLNTISTWSTAPALANLWYVIFNFDGSVVSASLLDKLNEWEDYKSNIGQGWGVTTNVVEGLLSQANQSGSNGEISLNGCVFARQVNIPGERVTINRTGLDYGGLLAPNTANTRNSPEMLTITFLETNHSFCDIILRPWLVMTSHLGMIARSDPSLNVKCKSVTLYQLAKNKLGHKAPLQVRKQIKFFNVVPTSVDGFAVAQDDGITNRTASFAYDQYVIG